MTVVVRTTRVRRAGVLVLRLRGVDAGTRLRVTWKRAGAKPVTRTVKSRGRRARVRAPRRPGTYTVTVRKRGLTLAVAKVSVR